MSVLRKNLTYFEYIRSRIPFPMMQEHCIRRGLDTARGWDLLKAKLDEISQINEDYANEIEQKVRDIFTETISVGNRALKIYGVDEEFRPQVLACLTSLIPEDSDYLRQYPKPMTVEQLALQGNELRLCSLNVANNGNSVNLIYCGRRVIEEREPRSRSEIGDVVINRLGWEQYDEFILIKRKFFQSFEVVRFSVDSGIIEIRVENRSGSNAKIALQQLQEKVNLTLASIPGSPVQLTQCRNLFPAIRPIYDNTEEGIVVELGFTTETGSAKHEKMRANRTDLRKELFHVGGKQAIKGALTPFRVAVRWPVDEQRENIFQEEILLPGSMRQLASGTPFLDHMVLSGSLTEQMMQAAVARVLAYLPTE